MKWGLLIVLVIVVMENGCLDVPEPGSSSKSNLIGSGDCNGDWIVDDSDIEILTNDALNGTMNCVQGDLNGDGAIDITDLISATNKKNNNPQLCEPSMQALGDQIYRGGHSTIIADKASKFLHVTYEDQVGEHLLLYGTHPIESQITMNSNIWNLKVVDRGVWKARLALDLFGIAHIAYIKDSKELMYASQLSNGNWVKSLVDVDKLDPKRYDQPIKFQITPSDMVHIFYRSDSDKTYNHYYRKNLSQSWQVSTIELPVQTEEIMVDNLDHTHVLFGGNGQSGLHHRIYENNGNLISEEDIDPKITLTKAVIDIDSRGRIHIAYTRVGDVGLWFADQLDDGTWVKGQALGRAYASDMNVKTHADGTVYLVYHQEKSGWPLKYIRRPLNGSWTTAPIDIKLPEESDGGHACDSPIGFTVDGFGRMHIFGKAWVIPAGSWRTFAPIYRTVCPLRASN